MINIHDYSDIINMKRPPLKHERMTMENRAAQFSPFAALTGYEASIDEEGRLTDERLELSNDENEDIRLKLNYLNENLDKEVSITYFVKDNKKNGGSYNNLNGLVKKLDNVEKCIIMSDKKRIPFVDIIKLDIKK